MITAKLYNLRIAPRKVRLVADLIRGQSAEEALSILNFTSKKAANPIIKLLNSALSNAKNNFQLEPANLYISKITVDEGPKLKRWRARARGSAYTILKRTSRINLVLDKIKGSKKIGKAKMAKKAEKVEKIEEAYQPEKSRPKYEAAARAEKPKSEKRISLKRIFRRKVF